MSKIETGKDLKRARHVLGWSVVQLAAALRLEGTRESVTARLRRWERGTESVWGPVGVAVEGFLAEHGLTLDGE